MTTTFAKPGIRTLLTQANETAGTVHLTLLLTNGLPMKGQLLDYDDSTGLLLFAEKIAGSLPKQPRYYADIYIDVNHIIGVRFLEPTS